MKNTFLIFLVLATFIACKKDHFPLKESTTGKMTFGVNKGSYNIAGDTVIFATLSNEGKFFFIGKRNLDEGPSIELIIPNYSGRKTYSIGQGQVSAAYYPGGRLTNPLLGKSGVIIINGTTTDKDGGVLYKVGGDFRFSVKNDDGEDEVVAGTFKAKNQEINTSLTTPT